MTFDKKNIVLIVCVLAVIVLIVIIYKYRKEIFGNSTEDVLNQGAPIIHAPTSSQYTSDSFPLHIGSGGDNVKNLQSAINRMKGALGITLVVDGKFGPKTESAVAKVLNGTKTVSVDDYNKYFKPILATNVGGSSTVFNIGDYVRSNSNSTILFDKDFNNVGTAKIGQYLGGIVNMGDKVVQVVSGLDSNNKIDNNRYWVSKDLISKI